MDFQEPCYADEIILFITNQLNSRVYFAILILILINILLYYYLQNMYFGSIYYFFCKFCFIIQFPMYNVNYTILFHKLL